MNTHLKWTAAYILLILAAVVLFLLGQWGAACTVIAVTALINRAVSINSLLRANLLRQDKILQELVLIRHAATEPEGSAPR